MTVNEHLWDFPHAMTLKVMGAADAPLEEVVGAILDEFLNDFDPNGNIFVTPSSKGNFISVNAKIVVETKEQVAAIYASLNANKHVKIVF